MVVCTEQGADLHMTQLMPLPLTDSCFSKIQIGFTFLVPADLGSPGKRAVNGVCVWYLHRHTQTTERTTCMACLENEIFSDFDFAKRCCTTGRHVESACLCSDIYAGRSCILIVQPSTFESIMHTRTVVLLNNL